MIAETVNTARPPQAFCWPAGFVLGLLLMAAGFPGRGQEAELDSTPFRIGFSHGVFNNINENDAKAAVKVWGQTIARERGIPTDPDPCIFQNTPELLKALRGNLVDAVGITIIEYAALNRDVRFAPIFITYNSGSSRDQYLVLVHRDSKLEHLADLRGRSLALHQDLRDCLAQPWLDTLLIQEEGKPAVEWFGRITQSTKISQVVLPVFFHQSDACVVTRTGFKTMCELNPQLGQQLKVIARSPELVTAVFCFRADYAPAFKEKVFAGVRNLYKTLAGQQVLTIFRCEKLEDQPASCLDSTLELVAQHAQLVNSQATKAPLPESPPQLPKGFNP